MSFLSKFSTWTIKPIILLSTISYLLKLSFRTTLSPSTRSFLSKLYPLTTLSIILWLGLTQPECPPLEGHTRIRRHPALSWWQRIWDVAFEDRYIFVRNDLPFENDVDLTMRRDRRWKRVYMRLDEQGMTRRRRWFLFWAPNPNHNH